MQNRVNDQAAFILHRRDYQDSSLILDVFSEDFGRLTVLAKAAKKRRDVAHFQICNRLLLGWSGRSELKILTQIDSQSLSLASDYLPSIFYLNELLLYLLPRHEEQRGLFKQYQMLLLNLAQKETEAIVLEPLLRGFEIELLTILGVMPDLSMDNIRQQKVESNRYYYFEPASGPLLAKDPAVNAFSGEALHAIQNRQFESSEVLRLAKRLMRQIIDYNLQGRTLQSRKFYQQMKKK